MRRADTSLERRCHCSSFYTAPRESLYRAAERLGFALLVPESRDSTWDGIRYSFGPDIAFLDEALEYTFERLAADPNQVCLAGFSDGVSYARAVGVANGDLCTHAAGWSPGFMVVTEHVGKPRIYVSHGTEDTLLPLRQSRDRIVPTLKDREYHVTCHEFEGGHVLPRNVMTEALDWFLG